MPRNYDNTDLFWTSRGDLLIDNGDLKDTYDDPLRSFVQEIKTRIESVQGDWRNFSSVGADLDDFVGEPNNQITAESVKTRIISALSRDSFLNTRDLKITYMPVSIEQLLVRVSVQVATTGRNRNSSQLSYNLLYNYSDNNVYFIQ